MKNPSRETGLEEQFFFGNSQCCVKPLNFFQTPSPLLPIPQKHNLAKANRKWQEESSWPDLTTLYREK